MVHGSPKWERQLYSAKSSYIQIYHWVGLMRPSLVCLFRGVQPFRTGPCSQMLIMNEYAEARLNMIDRQLRPNKVSAQPVIDAFLQVERERFVPASLKRSAYLDTSLPLGRGRGLIDPTSLGRMVQAAEIVPTDRVLVVGANRGYEVALIASLASCVIGLESDADLVAAATQTLNTIRFTDGTRVAMVHGPLADGVASDAPFNVVLVAGALPMVPQGLFAQLADGGRLVAVIASAGQGLQPISVTGTGALGEAIIFHKRDGNIGKRSLFETSVPALPGFAMPEKFVF